MDVETTDDKFSMVIGSTRGLGGEERVSLVPDGPPPVISLGEGLQMVCFVRADDPDPEVTLVLGAGPESLGEMKMSLSTWLQGVSTLSNKDGVTLGGYQSMPIMRLDRNLTDYLLLWLEDQQEFRHLTANLT